MMWNREDQLVAIRIAEMRADADRMRLEKQVRRSTGRLIPAAAAAAGQLVGKALASARHTAAVIGAVFDTAAVSPDYPAGMLGGQGHHR